MLNKLCKGHDLLVSRDAMSKNFYLTHLHSVCQNQYLAALVVVLDCSRQLHFDIETHSKNNGFSIRIREKNTNASNIQ